MSFCSVNETSKFGYNDCIIVKSEIREDGIKFELEALIVRANNSQNTNYTDSYAGETCCYMKNGKIKSFVKAGYKYYDANDNLIEEKPDEELKLTNKEAEALLTEIYMSELEKNDDGTYTVVAEVISEDISENVDVYIITIECDEVEMTWEHYMNRVQNN